MPVEGWTPSAARTLVLPTKAATPRGFVQTPEALRWPDKRSGELLDYSVDLTARLEAGDTLASIAATISPATAAATKIIERDMTGSIITVWLNLGANGIDHLITLAARTVLGRTFVVPVALYILPPPGWVSGGDVSDELLLLL